MREHLDRILSTPPFVANPRASAFLRHIVDRALTGRTHEIKEATIGVEVFGRSPSYDTKSDQIVRSVARVLREKLNDYYAGSPGDLVRIELAKGSYIPAFRRQAVPQVAPTGDPPRQDTDNLPPRTTVWWTIPAVAVLLAAAALLVEVSPTRPKSQTASAPTAADAGIPPAIASDPEALYRQGRQRFLSGDYPGARPLLRRAVALVPQNALAHAAYADDLRMLGYNSAALEQARLAQANTSGLPASGELEVEATFLESSGDHKGAIRAISKLQDVDPARLEYGRAKSRAELEDGDYSGCLREVGHLREALGRPATDDPQLSLTEAFCRAGTGNYQLALSCAQRAARLASRSGIREVYARARLLEAGLLMSTGHAEQSRAIREEARMICESLGDHSCVLRAARVQANMDLYGAGPITALAEYRQALPVAREFGSAPELIELLNGEGWALAATDDFAGANAAFVEALLTAQKTGLPLHGARISLAELAEMEGQHARAAILAEQSAADARQAGDMNAEADALALQSQMLLTAGDLPGADRCLALARRHTHGVKLPNATATLLQLSAAMLDRIRGKFDSTASQLAEARSTSDSATDIELSTQLIELALDQGRYQEAEGFANQALKRLANTGRVSEVARITALLSDAYGFGDRREDARDAASSARSLLSSRSAPIARITALISSGRWAEKPSDAEEYIEEAIGLSRQMGFRLSEFDARYVLLELRQQSGRSDAQAGMQALLSEMRRVGVRSISHRAGNASHRSRDVPSLQSPQKMGPDPAR